MTASSSVGKASLSIIWCLCASVIGLGGFGGAASSVALAVDVAAPVVVDAAPGAVAVPDDSNPVDS